jgi:hypothetical protein
MQAELPKSLRQHAAYQEEYRQRLMQLPYFKVMAPIIETFLRAIIDRGAFYIRVHLQDLEAILDSGAIKSMMETGHGATVGGEKTRKEVVKALFGCDPEKLLPSEFPKYGFLSQSDAKADLIINGGMWSQYGDVSIQLKKDRLFHRTTLCVGNSVNMGRCYTLVPTRVDNVKATCLCGLPHDGEPLIHLADPNFCYYKFVEWIVKKQLTVQNFAQIDMIADDIDLFEFFELQYHGDLDIRRDVARIDVEPSSKEEQSLLEQLQPRFEAIGVPLNID